MSSTKYDQGMQQTWAQALAAMAAGLEPRKAAVLYTELARTLDQSLTRLYPQLEQGLVEAVARLGPREAAALCKPAATAHIQAMARPAIPYILQQPVQGLATVLARETPGLLQQRVQRCRGVAALFGPAMAPSLGVLAPLVLQPAPEPRPEPLPPQLLVDLLKQPLCVGEARRLVLEQLARHYGRPFTDQWDFVRFATDRKLGLDLLTPPRHADAAGR